jgi:chaperone modulatory protein CbpM
MRVEPSEFLAHTRLSAEVVETWIAAGWLVPGRIDGARSFSEVDIARARLIRDLQQALGVNDEAVPVILDLLDQMHGLRRALRALSAALAAQPEETRRTIIADLRAPRASRESGG